MASIRKRKLKTQTTFQVRVNRSGVREIVKSCSEKNFREILLITGKGIHSNQENVYRSSDFSKLKFSVPEFINSDTEISKLILSIDNPSQKEGGEGALLIKLRKL